MVFNRQTKIRCLSKNKFVLGHSTLLVVLSTAVLSLTLISCAQSMVDSDYPQPAYTKFSFNEPSTFHWANEQQKATLRAIAKDEFSLAHLAKEDQDLLDEALRYSGVEVHHACVIDQITRAKFRAFFGRWAPDRHVRYHPTHGFKDLKESQDEELIQSEWKRIYTDISEYPYPFSEAQVLAKVVPVDLSSIQLQSRSDTTAQYTGLPSMLLTTSVAEDNIVEREDLAIDFSVNLETKRITTLTLYLPKSVRVYRGIRLQKLRITYEFENDSISNRNVLASMQQTMKGRIWFLFRPKLFVVSKLKNVECLEEPASQSYLYESIDAIKALDLSPER